MKRPDIDFSGRPNKSLVRGRILSIIERTLRPEHMPEDPMAYISLSGYQFLDTIDFYKRFGIRNVYSIERDERVYRRAKFNLPFQFFSVTRGRLSRFIDEKLSGIVDHSKVLYLDYLDIFSDMIIKDIETLFASAFFDKKGLLFITFNMFFRRRQRDPRTNDIVPPEIQSPEAFKGWLERDFGHYVLDKVQRRYRRNKKVTEVIKAVYCDRIDMAILGYLIDDCDEEEIVLDPIEQMEEFRLPSLTFLEKNYIRNNLDKPPSDIARQTGLPENDVREVLENM